MPSHPAEQYIKTVVGPFAIVKSCTICGFSDSRKPGYGRGSGMRAGNQSRGRIIQHIKAEHPEVIQ